MMKVSVLQKSNSFLCFSIHEKPFAGAQGDSHTAVRRRDYAATYQLNNLSTIQLLPFPNFAQ